MQSAAARTGASSRFHGLHVLTSSPIAPPRVHAVDDLSIERLRTARARNSPDDTLSATQTQRMANLVATGVCSPSKHSTRPAKKEVTRQPLSPLNSIAAEQQQPSPSPSPKPSNQHRGRSSFFRLRSMSPTRRARVRQEQQQQQEQQEPEEGRRSNESSSTSCSKLAIQIDGAEETSSDSGGENGTAVDNTETKVHTCESSDDDGSVGYSRTPAPAVASAAALAVVELRKRRNTDDETATDANFNESGSNRRAETTRRNSCEVPRSERRPSLTPSRQQMSDSAAAALAQSSRRGSAVLSWLSGTPRNLSSLARRARASRRNSCPPESSVVWTPEDASRRRRSDGGVVLTGRELVFQSMAEEFEEYLVITNDVPVFDPTASVSGSIDNATVPAEVLYPKPEPLVVD